MDPQITFAVLAQYSLLGSHERHQRLETLEALETIAEAFRLTTSQNRIRSTREALAEADAAQRLLEEYVADIRENAEINVVALPNPGLV